MSSQFYYLYWKVRVPFQLVMQRYDLHFPFWFLTIDGAFCAYFYLRFQKVLIFLCKFSWGTLCLRFLLVMEYLMQAVEVAESFRLFATITTSQSDVSHALEGLFICS
jgi:hypothetical protein